MRIFNWVHRRFVPKDGLSHQNLRKDEEGILNTEADTKALLDENANYHGWNGAAGILSIGTFGLLKDELSLMMIHSNIKNGNEHKEYMGFLDKEVDREKWDAEADLEYSHHHEDDDEEEEDDDDDDEWEDDDHRTISVDGEEYYQEENDEVEGEWNPLLYDRNSTGKGSLFDHSLKYYEEVSKKRERITLADLFSAESEDDQQPYYCSSKLVPPNHNSKYTNSNNKKLDATTPDHVAAPKTGLLFVKKKLIPRVKEDSRPIQKLHGLMKRMLKRKIHPDINVEGKIKPCVAATAISLGHFDRDANCHELRT